MASPLRVEYPGAYYHVINRGNAGENIFIEFVCDEFGYREEQVKMRGRKDNKARAIAMYLARDLSGISGNGLGAFFNGISGAAITMKYNQMNAELMRNKKLHDKIATLKKQILNI
ncbi:MAG: hypothetical protein Q7J31_02465 [Syntrophales bacterium]|uniref:hypothetical protein n=1 Tax=Candidatus Wunengus sp. YC61 TaxID=3367698 RepID=UPI00271F7925|nr:hypothetical protein [Syntrophales bacterium]